LKAMPYITFKTRDMDHHIGSTMNEKTEKSNHQQIIY